VLTKKDLRSLWLKEKGWAEAFLKKAKTSDEIGERVSYLGKAITALGFLESIATMMEERPSTKDGDI
jgi:hypothetical protein